MPLLQFVLLLSLAAVAVIVYIFARKQKVLVSRTWDCGTDLRPRMEISGTGFSRSLILIFKGILRPTKQTAIEYRDADIRYYPKAKTIRMEVGDVYNKYFYLPTAKATEMLGNHIKRIQGGNVNIYILYIFIMLIVLLTFYN
jgi:hydrogenase-4 component B